MSSAEVKQPSSKVVVEGTKELNITCSHDVGNLLVMLWYQHQQSSQTMSFIGYSYPVGDPSYEDQFKESRFQIKREDTLKGSLIIHEVKASDSAVYFCAASTQ